MSKVLDLLGKRVGRLLVVERSENSSKGNSRWKCQCDCGEVTIVNGTNLSSSKTQSCGCLGKEKIGNLNRTHSMYGSREWNSWRGMKSRCNNPKDTHFHLYGARGISYDSEWEFFDNFFQDMGNCPEDYQLDRIDVNQGYYKENCRWTDKTIQAYNIRLKSNNTTGRTGVTQRSNGKYYASITVYKKVIFLGTFLTFEAACKAREKAELEYYGIVKE